MKVLLISPVAMANDSENKAIVSYVKQLKDQGAEVHWPFYDTNQDDPTGGFQICRDNCQKILESDEIHIWYNETSGGSKFDMGAVFMLVEMLGLKKKIVIANDAKVVDDKKKSFFKVFRRLAEKTKNIK
jgi:hypothetical protein